MLSQIDLFKMKTSINSINQAIEDESVLAEYAHTLLMIHLLEADGSNFISDHQDSSQNLH